MDRLRGIEVLRACYRMALIVGVSLGLWVGLFYGAKWFWRWWWPT